MWSLIKGFFCLIKQGSYKKPVFQTAWDIERFETGVLVFDP